MCVNLRERIRAPSSAAFGIHPRWGHCSWDEGDLFILEVSRVCVWDDVCHSDTKSVTI